MCINLLFRWLVGEGSWNDETCGLTRAFLCRVRIEPPPLKQGAKEPAQLFIIGIGGLLTGCVLLFVRERILLNSLSRSQIENESELHESRIDED